MKKKACKQCRRIVGEKENKCKCGSTEFAENWKGKIIILNPEESEVAKKLKINEKGEYALKI